VGARLDEFHEAGECERTVVFTAVARDLVPIVTFLDVVLDAVSAIGLEDALALLTPGGVISTAFGPVVHRNACAPALRITSIRRALVLIITIYSRRIDAGACAAAATIGGGALVAVIARVVVRRIDTP